MPQADIDPATAARMGYENIIAACNVGDPSLPVEICLIGPGTVYGDDYQVAVHFDCNPDIPDRGTSEINSCGKDRAAALDAYRERVAELQSPPPAPTR